MRAVTGTAEPRPGISLTVIAGALALLALAVLSGVQPLAVAVVVAAGVVLTIAHRGLLSWRSLLTLITLVILFVPMRRYTLPGSLPFELDPYRVIVLFVLAGWSASLLADPRVRLRRSGLEAPLLLILVATVASVLANGARVTQGGAEVGKDLTFLLSYLLVFFLIVSVTRGQDKVDALIKVIVGGGAVVAGCAIFESRTHFNLFDHLSTVIPILQQQASSETVLDMRGFRAFGSAQHPIALSAALVLLVPISVYLVQRSGQRRWWLAAGLLFAGSLATMSRTSVIMLVVVGIVFVLLRPGEVKRLLPALIPGLVLVHFALPGTLITLKQSFFPTGGLLAQQQANAGYSGQGRLADIGPALDSWSQNPLFGGGYGTRIIGAAGIDGQILDDQWLGTLLETGLLGVIAWLWLVFWCISRFGRAARADRSSRGWLMTAVTASTAAFSVGMFFFDAFAFIQVTLLFFMLIAVGTVALAEAADPGRRIELAPVEPARIPHRVEG